MRAHYDSVLLNKAALGPLTADQIGEIVGCYAPDAVTRLRARKDIRVTVVGNLPRVSSRGPAKKLYKIDKIDSSMRITGPYCCGYCEQQRRLLRLSGIR